MEASTNFTFEVFHGVNVGAIYESVVVDRVKARNNVSAKDTMGPETDMVIVKTDVVRYEDQGH